MIPKCPEEVTEKWLESVTGEKVKELYQCGKQNGLMSCIFFAQLENESKLFIKIMPQSFIHETIISHNFLDVAEITVYRDIVPELSRRLNDPGFPNRILPGFYCGDFDLKDRKFHLCLEDLTSKGFEMKSADEGLTRAQILSCLKKIAEFHAAALSYTKTNEIVDTLDSA